MAYGIGAAFIAGIAGYLAATRPCHSRVHKHRHWRWSGPHRL